MSNWKALGPSTGNTYLSSGMQLGMNSKGNFFISAQVTFGYLSESMGLPIGLIIGKRHYKMDNKEWEKYNYIDAQVWVYYGGVGVGAMIDENKNKYARFKCGIGAFGYLTYDSFKVTEKNYGLIRVWPALIDYREEELKLRFFNGCNIIANTKTKFILNLNYYYLTVCNTFKQF